MANKLSLNIAKTHYLVFAGNKAVSDNLNIIICDQYIERSYSTKYLGIIIDYKLTWNDHVRYIQSKLSKSCGILYKVKHILTKETLHILYYSLIYPYLQYCNVVWGMATKSVLNPLMLLQKRIVRIISNVNYYDHTDPLYKSLGVLKINDIFVLESLKFVHCQLHTQQIFSFTRVLDVHNVNTRSRNQLRPSFPRTELQRRFVLYSGCQNWNALPIDIQNIRNKVSFKIKAKRLIIDQY